MILDKGNALVYFLSVVITDGSDVRDRAMGAGLGLDDNIVHIIDVSFVR